MKPGVVAGLCALALVALAAFAGLLGVWPFKRAGIPPVVNADGTTTYTLVWPPPERRFGSTSEFLLFRFPSTVWVKQPRGERYYFNGSSQGIGWPPNSYVSLLVRLPEFEPISTAEYLEIEHKKSNPNDMNVGLYGPTHLNWEKYYKESLQKCEKVGEFLPRLIEYKNAADGTRSGSEFGTCNLPNGSRRFAATDDKGRFIADTTCHKRNDRCHSDIRLVDRNLSIFFPISYLKDWWSIHGKVQSLFQDALVEVRVEKNE